MKILLAAVNAKYIHSNLAVYSLRAYANKQYPSCSGSVEIAEFTINQRSEWILRELYKQEPDVLCFSCYIWNYAYIREIAAEFYKLRPEVMIWLGGPEVTYEAKQVLLQNPAVFGIMIGEGERAFARIADAYCRNDRKALLGTPGICCRTEEGRIFCNEALPQPLDLSEIPFCYSKMEDFENRIVYYESSRGCPFSCSYCLSSLDRHLRFRDLSLVCRELLFFIEQEVSQVKFVDRTFNCNLPHAMAIWKFIEEHDRGVTNFHFEIAADILSEEALKLLEELRPGLIQLEIGVQSVHARTIEEIQRKMDLAAARDAVARILKAGNIHVHLDLIAGLPYEGYEQFAQSFREIYAWKPNQLQLGFLKVLKGSKIHGCQEEYGILCQNSPPYEVMATRWLSYRELLEIKLAEEMLEVYYNSGQFEASMKLFDVVYEDSFAFFLDLGRFYEKKGCLGISHSRIKRCSLLLEFAKEGGRIGQELLEEALLYDLYCRENIKSRPGWACDPSAFRRETKMFCKNGKLSHIEPFFYDFPKKGTRSITKLPKRLAEEIYVLFEYENRDPVSYQAKTTVIRKEDIQYGEKTYERDFKTTG